MKIKKNDNVAIITGKDKGKSGIVERVFPKEDKLIIKGIAIAKKHIKPSKKAPQGGIIEINQKVDVSNVMMVCPACGKLSKIAYKIGEKGKTRVCKKCNQSLEGGNQ